jgi:hypothetical protein
LNNINEIYETCHKKSNKTKIINKNKHKLLSEKSTKTKKIHEIRKNIDSINNNIEKYKKGVQKIFEEHTIIIDKLLKDKELFGIQSSKKISIENTFKLKNKSHSPLLKNNFYEDSFSETMSNDENSFDIENGFKSFSKRKNSDQIKLNSSDTFNENINSPKLSPSEEKCKNNYEVSSYDSSLHQIMQNKTQSPSQGKPFTQINNRIQK